MLCVPSRVMLIVVLCSGSWVPRSSAAPSPAPFRAEPASLVVPSGQDGKLVVHVDAGADPAARVLSLWANEGSFGKVEPLGGGKFRAQWTAPGLGFPTVLLMRADLMASGRLLRHWLAVPVSISMGLAVEAARGDTVQIVIGANDFGPVVAKAKGRVNIPIVVPPAAGSYTVNRTDEYGVTKSDTERFGLPPFKRMAIVGPAKASAGEIIELEVFHVNALGHPYTSEVALEVNCQDGSLVKILGREAVQKLRVKLGGRTGPIECRVFLSSESKVNIFHNLEVGVSRKVALSVETSRNSLPMGSASTAKVLVRSRDLYGNTADAPGLTVTVNGRPLEVSRIEPGLYQGWAYAPSSRQPGDRLVVRAVAPDARPSEASIHLLGGTAASVSPSVHPRAIQADGKRWVLLEARATDRNGMPANDENLQVTSQHGKLLFLHRVNPGFFRGHFVPHRRTGGGQAVISVQTPYAPEVKVSLALRPIPQRFLLSPVVGGFGDAIRTAGAGLALRFEYGAYAGKPNVFVGGAVLVAPGFSVGDGQGTLVDHRGLHAGATFLARLRLLSTLRFGLDVSLDAGVLAIYSSFRERVGAGVQELTATSAAFTASAALEGSVVTTGRQEIFFLLQVRYLTARLEDAEGGGRVILFGGLGYRFPL